MTYTSVVNGVTFTANPAVEQNIGPSGQPIEFTSRAAISGGYNLQSLPIRIDFDTPVITFGIRVVGQTYPNHRLQAYGEDGYLIAENVSNATRPDLGDGGSNEVVSIGGSVEKKIAYIMLVPPANDYVGYSDVTILIPLEDPDNPDEPNTPDPTDVFVATRISQMYSFSPSVTPHHDLYQIGVRSPTITSASFRFRNDTVNTVLQFNFTLPTGASLVDSFSFLKTNLPIIPPNVNTPDGPNIPPPPPGAPGRPRLTLQPLEQFDVIVSFNDDGVDDTKGAQNIDSFFTWNPIPLNVDGPVYVYNGLPALGDPNIIIIPTEPIPGEPDPLPEEPIPEVPPTHLYLSLSPANPRVPYRGTQTVELIAWAGDEFVAPNVVHAKKLNFAPNSLVWQPLSSTQLTIDPLDGSSAARFTSRTPLRWSYGRKTNFAVYIASPPINMDHDLWEKLYRSGVGVLGDNNAVRAPLPDGRLTYKLTGVATS